MYSTVQTKPCSGSAGNEAPEWKKKHVGLKTGEKQAQEKGTGGSRRRGLHHQPIVPAFQGQWPLGASAAAVMNTSADIKAGSN